jgi:peptide/nickel transport system substrate-binding protein
MKSIKRIKLAAGLSALSICVFLVLSACGGAAAPAGTPVTAPAAATQPAAPKSGGVLRIGIDVDAGTADPRLMVDTTANRLRELVYDGLVYIKADFSAAPMLAESWDNPDDKTWIFHLRKGVKFHNGQVLTADDVKYTFDTILDPKLNAPGRGNLSVIQKVEAVDANTVKFTLASAFSPFLAYMGQGIVPKAVVEAAGSDLANKPVGTGPFKFVSWQRAASIVVEAFPDYWGGRPKLDRVEFKIVPDNSARVVALESGDLDLVISPLSPQDVLRMTNKQGFTVERIPAAGYTYINLNCSDPILADVKVRQALEYLVNREQITSTIYKGIGQVAKGPIPPGMWAYSADLPAYDYNVDKAKQLLDDAGWKAGADGKRSKNGAPLKITLRTHTEDPDRRTVIEALQAEFVKAGITADTAVTDFASLLPDLNAGKYQFVVIGWLGLSNPDAAMFRQFTDGGAANYGKCVDPQVDQLIKQARVTLDQAKAKDLYSQASKIVVQNAYYIFLQYQEVISIHRADMQGFTMNPVTYFYSLRTTSLGK